MREHDPAFEEVAIGDSGILRPPANAAFPELKRI
jgi:hypothetical protein